MRYQTFIVEFKGTFPLDMLRYDSCFPASTKDANIIFDSIKCHNNGKVEIGRYIQNKKDRPTIARWESFSCKVSDISTR